MSEKQMNIVFMLSDQHRWDALSCNGAAVVKTPHIDSIATEGMRFDGAYTACPLCTPARASLLTGLLPHNHGQLANMDNFNGIFDQQVLGKKGYPEYLHDAGYQVGYTGKWHLPKEGDKQFWNIDQWHNDHQSVLKQAGVTYNMAVDEVQPLEWGAEAKFYGKSALPLELNYNTYVADRTIDMINQFSSDCAPFMICSAFTGPHFPIAVPEPYLSMYNPEDVPMWGNFHETFMDKPIVQQKEMMRWNSSHLTWKDWQKVIAAYWGYCTYIDAQIGRIITRLKEQGIYENTIIIYSSDHGDMLGSHRLFNKGWNMYEECNRIPLLIRWPNTALFNSVCKEFVNLVDIMPTLLEAAGTPCPEKIDGKSLVPLLKGNRPDDWPGEALVEFNGYESSLTTIRMIRTEKWKYVYNPSSVDELYDMESDPDELYNLADRLAFKHVLRRMKDRMVKRLQSHRDGIVGTTSWQSNSYDLFISDRER